MDESEEKSPGRAVAVLTGDVVGSSELPGDVRQSLPERLRRAAAAVREDFPDELPHPIDLFRGDSWQWFVADPGLALRVAVLFRSLVKGSERRLKLDTRVAIGVGTVDFLSSRRLSESDGRAFRRSGEALEGMPSRRRLCLSTGGLSPALEPILDSLVAYVDRHVTELTERQAWVLARSLQGWTQERMGKESEPPVEQSAVAHALARTDIEWIDDALKAVEVCLRS